MKKYVLNCLCFALVVGLLLGVAPVQAESAKLKVVSTIFPQYDFVRQIAGDAVENTLLLRAGSDSHSYELSPEDVKNIQNADLFIYVGGPDDHKFESLLESLGKDAPKTLKLTDHVKVLEEEIKEGMEHNHDHGHGHDHHHDFKKEDIEERELSEFAGEYRNLSAYVLAGDFDAVAEHRKEDGETAEEYKNECVKYFGTEVDYMNVTAEGISYVKDGKVVASANYSADGIFIEEPEEGHLHAMYQFKKTAGDDALPTYVLLDDHQIKANQERPENPHFHFAYSNESYAAAAANEVSPFMVKAGLTAADLEAMFIREEDHDHDDHDEEDHDHDHDEEDHDHEDHDHDEEDHDHEDHDHHDHEHEMDEHVWTSPKNAQKLVDAIANTLVEMDPANAELYKTNSASYNKKLAEVDKAFEEVVKNGKKDILLFGDRFPFRYFVEDYDLDYYAAFTGCSADTEVSPKTVSFLIEKAKENKVPAILKIELTDSRIADTIAEEVGAKVLTLNSGHNLNAEDFEKGVSLVDLLWQNVEVLKEALQ